MQNGKDIAERFTSCSLRTTTDCERNLSLVAFCRGQTRKTESVRICQCQLIILTVLSVTLAHLEWSCLSNQELLIDHQMAKLLFWVTQQNRVICRSQVTALSSRPVATGIK